MKMINLVAASVLVATASVAMADNTGFYTQVLAGYGKVKASNTSSDLDVKKNHGIDAGINAGYMFTDNFGVEAGFMQYSNVKYYDLSVSGTTSGASLRQNYNIHVAGVAKYDLTNEFNVFGKLGLANVHSKGVFTTTDADGSQTDKTSESKMALFTGAGVGYNVNQHVEVSFETDYTTKSHDVPAMYSANVGVAYKF
jgi:opacity protein-like surface antigen